MKAVSLLTLLLLSLLLSPGPAHAQEQKAPIPPAIALMIKQFRETMAQLESFSSNFSGRIQSGKDSTVTINGEWAFSRPDRIYIRAEYFGKGAAFTEVKALLADQGSGNDRTLAPAFLEAEKVTVIGVSDGKTTTLILSPNENQVYRKRGKKTSTACPTRKAGTRRNCPSPSGDFSGEAAL